MGYDYDEAGQLVVNETEAETVRLIFRSYLDGMSCGTIARMLDERNFMGKNGTAIRESGVRYILKNEVYTGALLCQKTFTTELPERKKKWNNGEMQMYLIEDDHEAIVSKEDFEAAQRIMARRGANLQNGRRYLFSGKIVCGDCGGIFCRRVVSGEVYWLCGNHIKRRSCGQALDGKVREKDIRQAFARLSGRLKQNKEILEDMCGRFAEMEGALRQSGGSPDIRNKIAGLERQAQVLSQMLGDGYLDPAFYIPEKNRIQGEREELEAALDVSGGGFSMQEYAERTEKGHHIIKSQHKSVGRI